MNNSCDFVVIGGGPIGTWTALQIKMRSPDARILVYERHPVYQRDHILSIRKESFLQWSKSSKSNADFLRRIYQAQATYSETLFEHEKPPVIDFDNIAGSKLLSWRSLPSVLDIRTIDFERILKEESQRLGIRFVYEKVEHPNEVMDRHPECRHFIAADGANSKMRTFVFGENAIKRRDIFPSLDFNYVSYGQPKYLPINTYDKLGHVFAEYVGLKSEGRSKINIRFIVSKDEYAAVPEATFKNPLTVTPDSEFWNRLGPSQMYGRTLKQDFYDLLGLRHEHAHDNPSEDTVTMTKIYLSQYRAREFAKSIMSGGKKRTWYLVGDAAMGMPFFRSVNSGLILGAQLAYLLTTNLVGDEFKAGVYNHYTKPSRVMREFTRVAAVEARIRFYTGLLRPFYHHTAHSFAAPLVRGPLDWGLKKLGRGVLFPAK